MKLKVFSVFDSSVATFSQPFLLPTVGAAKRAWVETAQDPQTTINRYPADFTLFQISEFDDQTGTYENLTTPLSLGTALQALSAAKANSLEVVQ